MREQQFQTKGYDFVFTLHTIKYKQYIQHTSRFILTSEFLRKSIQKQNVYYLT